MSHGVSVSEQATSVKSMVAGDSALPVIFGTAPVNIITGNRNIILIIWYF